MQHYTENVRYNKILDFFDAFVLNEVILAAL